MGFMHDTLAYFEHEPVHRKFHHNLLTFRSIYAFHENFVLPLSHDEVVHGKGSLLAKMPGDEWQRFANLRLLYAYMFAQPGKKLLFMGGEFGQGEEWDHDSSLNWAVAGQGLHAGVQRLMTDLNRIYRTEPALHERDVDVRGFEWIAGNDSEQSVFAFLRVAEHGDPVIAVFNCTPIVRYDYSVGVPAAGNYIELVNTDAHVYGGSDIGNWGGVTSAEIPFHGRPHSIKLTLPPLAALILRRSAG
jgi:1,4-alpha-glucan branching enzyme